MTLVHFLTLLGDYSRGDEHHPWDLDAGTEVLDPPKLQTRRKPSPPKNPTPKPKTRHRRRKTRP
jgi:hypothetical protein